MSSRVDISDPMPFAHDVLRWGAAMQDLQSLETALQTEMSGPF